MSGLGLGCWAIGGPFTDELHLAGGAAGWGEVDDRESLRALRRAIELGISFFDTADNYGCGRSERLLGQAIAGRREQVIVATKFGNRCDQARRAVIGEDASPSYIRQACEQIRGQVLHSRKSTSTLRLPACRRQVALLQLVRVGRVHG